MTTPRTRTVGLAALALVSALELGSGSRFSVQFGTVQVIGSSNYTGKDGHFWMPQPLFRSSSAMHSALVVKVGIHGDGVPCPPPDRPHQPCSEGFSQLQAPAATSGAPVPDAPWVLLKYGAQPGNSLVRVNATVTRGFGGLALNTSTNDTAQIFYHDWVTRSASPFGAYLRNGEASVTGMPPMLSLAYLQGGASAVVLGGVVLTQFYGFLQDAPAKGGCKGPHSWNKPYCDSVITIASTNQGRNWTFRSAIHWDGDVMPAAVGGRPHAPRQHPQPRDTAGIMRDCTSCIFLRRPPWHAF